MLFRSNSDGGASGTANAYGRALAVLSAALDMTKNDPVPLTTATLAASLQSSTSSASPFKFSDEIASQLKTVTEKVVDKGLIAPDQAFEIQQATLGNPTAAVIFKFSQDTWNLTPSTKPAVDPVAAFGKTVYSLATAADAPMDTTANVLVLHIVLKSAVNFSLSGIDADAFTYRFDANSGTVTLTLQIGRAHV